MRPYVSRESRKRQSKRRVTKQSDHIHWKMVDHPCSMRNTDARGSSASVSLECGDRMPEMIYLLRTTSGLSVDSHAWIKALYRLYSIDNNEGDYFWRWYRWPRDCDWAASCWSPRQGKRKAVHVNHIEDRLTTGHWAGRYLNGLRSSTKSGQLSTSVQMPLGFSHTGDLMLN